MQMKPAVRMIRKRLNDGKPPSKEALAKAKAKAKKKTGAKLVKPNVSKARAELKEAKKKTMSRGKAALMRMRQERHDASDLSREKAREKIRKSQALLELARKRKAQGLPPTEDLTISMPAHQQLALQVRAGEEKEWSTVIGFKYYPGMTHSKKDCTCKDCLTDKLFEKQTGWQTSGYFGADAQFRVKEVTVQAQIINTGRPRPKPFTIGQPV